MPAPLESFKEVWKRTLRESFLIDEPGKLAVFVIISTVIAVIAVINFDLLENLSR